MKRCLLPAVLVLLLFMPADVFAMLHPLQSRFLQRDPVGYADGMNLYQLCSSAPTALLDPTGNAPDSPASPSETYVEPDYIDCTDPQKKLVKAALDTVWSTLQSKLQEFRPARDGADIPAKGDLTYWFEGRDGPKPENTGYFKTVENNLKNVAVAMHSSAPKMSFKCVCKEGRFGGRETAAAPGKSFPIELYFGKDGSGGFAKRTDRQRARCVFHELTHVAIKTTDQIRRIPDGYTYVDRTGGLYVTYTERPNDPRGYTIETSVRITHADAMQLASTYEYFVFDYEY